MQERESKVLSLHLKIFVTLLAKQEGRTAWDAGW